MDDRLREQVQGFVEQLLKEEKSSLSKARTFLKIENLTAEVGDEIAQQLASGDLSERSQQAASQGAVPRSRVQTPVRGGAGKRRDLQPIIGTG